MDQIHAVSAEIDHRTAAALRFVIEVRRKPVAAASVVTVPETDEIDLSQFSVLRNFDHGAIVPEVFLRIGYGEERPVLLKRGFDLVALC